MQNFISDKVLKLNELFYTAGCKFIADGRIRYFTSVKGNPSNITCGRNIIFVAAAYTGAVYFAYDISAWVYGISNGRVSCYRNGRCCNIKK